MNEIEKLRNLRGQVELDMDRYLEEGTTLTELASVYATQAMFIYRQLFNDEDYDRMIKTMYDNRMNVKKFTVEDILRTLGIDISK